MTEEGGNDVRENSTSFTFGPPYLQPCTGRRLTQPRTEFTPVRTSRLSGMRGQVDAGLMRSAPFQTVDQYGLPAHAAGLNSFHTVDNSEFSIFFPREIDGHN